MRDPATPTPKATGADSARRFNLLATALAGRTGRVAHDASGQPAWTDGATIVIDPAGEEEQQLAAVAVHACLVAAESLDPQIMRGLRRRSKVAARYLAVEGACGGSRRGARAAHPATCCFRRGAVAT